MTHLSAEELARRSILRSQAKQQKEEDEYGHLRAEVERLRALVGHYREVAAGILSHGLPVHCAECRKGLIEIAGDADGQQAVQVWDALLEVAEAALTVSLGLAFEPGCPCQTCNLRDALDHLRAVRDGDGTEEG